MNQHLNPGTKQGPLTGLRVVDLTRYIAGPFATLLLAQMGAEVIEIEPPGGAMSRDVGLILEGESTYHHVFHHSKSAITLNLRTDQGKSLLRELIQRSDVVVENFRPGTLARMGFSYDELKSLKDDIILVSISGFGQTGPWAQRPGFDAILQAMSGLMSLAGEPDGSPMMAGTFIADYATGVYAALGTTLALFHRERTGEGQVVDVSLLESLNSFLLTTVTDYLLTGKEPQRLGNGDRYGAPASVYAAKDGWVYLDAAPDSLFASLMKLIGREELVGEARFATMSDRLVNQAELDAVIGAWIQDRTRDEVLEQLGDKIPVGPIRSIPEVAHCPQLRARRQIIEVEEPRLGTIALPGVPITMSLTPGAIAHTAKPSGADNAAIFGELLGHSADELAMWAAANVV